MKENYFELLQIDRGFSIDLEALESNYLRLQQIYHPDKAQNSTERSKFLNISSSLNFAYKTLVSDLARAEYLLFLEDLSLKDVQLNKGCWAFSQKILTESLEKNEFLQETEDLAQVQNFLLDQLNQRKELISDMNGAFLNKNMQNFLLYTYQIKYLDQIISTAQRKLFNNC
jgi:molecular chaperone HscB